VLNNDKIQPPQQTISIFRQHRPLSADLQHKIVRSGKHSILVVLLNFLEMLPERSHPKPMIGSRQVAGMYNCLPSEQISEESAN